MDGPWEEELQTTRYLSENAIEIDAFVNSTFSPLIQAQALRNRIKSATQTLRESSRSPLVWLYRGKSLAHPKIGLVAEGLADLWRAERLLEAVTDVKQLQVPREARHLRIDASGTVDDHRRSARWLICCTLLLANSFAECVDNIPRRSRNLSTGETRYPELHILASDMLAKDRKHNISKGRRAPEPAERVARLGMIRPRIYPWMKKRDYRRDKKDEKAYQSQIHIVSDGMCALQPSTAFANTDQSPTTGIFATIDMPAKQKLFADKAALTALNISDGRCCWCFDLLAKKRGKHVEAPCGREFCTLACLSRSNHTFHNAESCVPNADPIHAKLTIEATDKDETGTETATRRLMSRVLLSCVNEFQKHGTPPLQHKLLRHINVDFAKGEKMLFSFERDLKQPMLYLEKLGIDIYSNENFDAWVMMMIWAKLLKSMWAYPDEQSPEVQWIGLGSAYFFFNHSCDPNVVCTKRKNSAIIDATTIKPVKKGEELCISYIENLSNKEKKRRDQLEHWTDQCQCSRCTADRANTAEDEASSDEDMLINDEEEAEDETPSQLLSKMRIPEDESDDYDYEPGEPNTHLDAGISSESERESPSFASEDEQVQRQLDRERKLLMKSRRKVVVQKAPLPKSGPSCESLKTKVATNGVPKSGVTSTNQRAKHSISAAEKHKRKLAAMEESDDSEVGLFVSNSAKRQAGHGSRGMNMHHGLAFK